jgi:hypothetical protein
MLEQGAFPLRDLQKLSVVRIKDGRVGYISRRGGGWTKISFADGSTFTFPSANKAILVAKPEECCTYLIRAKFAKENAAEVR